MLTDKVVARIRKGVTRVLKPEDQYFDDVLSTALLKAFESGATEVQGYTIGYNAAIDLMRSAAYKSRTEWVGDEAIAEIANIAENYNGSDEGSNKSGRLRAAKRVAAAVLKTRRAVKDLSPRQQRAWVAPAEDAKGRNVDGVLRNKTVEGIATAIGAPQSAKAAFIRAFVGKVCETAA